MAESDWASAREQKLMRWAQEFEAWIRSQERIWGPDWARRWRDDLEREKRRQQQQIRQHARQIADYRREVERNATKAGYRVSWR